MNYCFSCWGKQKPMSDNDEKNTTLDTHGRISERAIPEIILEIKTSLQQELTNWRQAIEKRLEVLEEATTNIKKVSKQQESDFENTVTELRQDIEMMQDNVIVDIA